MNVDKRSLRILDLFENAAGGYKLVPVQAVAVKNVTIDAKTYRAKKKLKPYLFGEWSLEHFERFHLAQYVSDRIPTLISRWISEGRLS